MSYTKQALIIVLSCMLSLSLATAAFAQTPPLTVPSADGVPIHYQVQGTGEPALLFVHGWLCDGTYWQAQVDYFAKQYTVVTIDLAGHGQSGAERKAWTLEAFGNDIVAVVEKLDLKKVVLIGHSMGGPVAIEAARRLPERVIGVIGVDTLQNVEVKAEPENLDKILAPLRENFVEFVNKMVRQMFPPTADPALVDKIATDMSSGPQDVGIGAMDAMLRYDLASAVEEVQAPIRCINSDKYPTDLEANRRHAKSFKVALMAGYGHFLYLEAPETFNSYLEYIVKEFVAGPAESPEETPAEATTEQPSNVPKDDTPTE